MKRYASTHYTSVTVKNAHGEEDYMVASCILIWGDGATSATVYLINSFDGVAVLREGELLYDYFNETERFVKAQYSIKQNKCVDQVMVLPEFTATPCELFNAVISFCKKKGIAYNEDVIIDALKDYTEAYLKQRVTVA